MTIDQRFETWLSTVGIPTSGDLRLYSAVRLARAAWHAAALIYGRQNAISD